MKRYLMKKRLSVLLMLLFLICFGLFVFAQEKKRDDDKNKILIDEILAVYKSKGEEGLREFMEKKTDQITAKLILDFVEKGRRIGREEWLKMLNISMILARVSEHENIQATINFELGNYYYAISEINRSLEYFEKSYLIFSKINDITGQAKVYLAIGKIHNILGDTNLALNKYNKALHLFKKTNDKIGLGDVYWRIGEIHSIGGDHKKALEFYEKSLDSFKTMNVPIGLGNVYVRIAIINFHSGQNAKALEMCDKALFYFNKAGNLRGKGNVFIVKGDIFSYGGDFFKALEMYDRALAFYNKIGDIVGQGNIYRQKGDILLVTGNQLKAVELYNKSLTYFEKAGEPLGQANVYTSKGDISLNNGDKVHAFEMYGKALSFYKKCGDCLGQGNVFQNMGELYWRIGDNLRALDMYNKAMALYEKGQYPLNTGNILMEKSQIYSNIGENTKALEMCQRALALFEKAMYPLSLGNLYKNMGKIYFNISNYSKAIEMFDKAYAFYVKAKHPLGKGGVLKKKGDVCFKMGNHTKALEFYNRALASYSENNKYIESIFHTQYAKATVCAKLGKTQEAFYLYEKSLDKLEALREQTPLEKMKISFLKDFYGEYEGITLFMLKNKYYSRGFNYAELMKSRAFLDQLSEGIVKLDKGIKPGLLKKRDDYVSKLSAKSKQIAEAAGKNDEKKLAELKDERRKIESEFEDLLIKIRLENPLYASVQYPQPVSLKELQEKVLKKGELMLHYFTTEERTYVFLVSKKKFKVFPLNITSKETHKLANRYILSVKGKNKEKLSEYGEKLYQSLFKPLEPLLKGKKEIIIVPDGELAKIPFESFVMEMDESGNPVYLLEKYNIKYIQSASVLSIMRKYYKRTSQTQNFIGFGDPVYDYENFKKGLPEQGSTNPEKGDEIKDIHRGKYDREGGIFDRLEGSGREVQTIAGLFQDQGQKAVIHLRANATEENAKSPDLKGFDYIHFSCHGVLGDGFQSLVLSQVPGAKEDGYLTLNEIMNCDYNAKLVVLSACQTGTGKVERGEGVTGLTRAVMYAGTPGVVASLWNVSDIGTKELMVRFYQNILEKGMSKEDALREAKLSLLKSGKYSSPYYWSPFVMYGE